MKLKKILCLFLALPVCLSSRTIKQFSNQEIIAFYDNLYKIINNNKPAYNNNNNINQAKNTNKETIKFYNNLYNQNLLNEINLAKSKLKPISNIEKNNYIKGLNTRRDFYNAQTDLRSFIKKLRLNQGVMLQNNTNNIINIKLILSNPNYYIPTNNDISKKEHLVTVQPNSFHIIDQDKNSILLDIELLNNKKLYINPKWTIDSQLQITIEDTEDRHFLHQYHNFNFKSEPISSSDNTYDNDFKNQFNSHIEYLDKFLAPLEGLSLNQIDQQRQKLYKINNISKIMKRDAAALDRYENKIPLITHKIWVTSDANPVSIPDYYIKWFENSIEHNPTSQGWTHILWIENKEKLPALAKRLENHPSIKLMELDKDIPMPMTTGNAYKEAIKNNKFGKASDILRLEILRQFGGYYLDTDYELYQSLKPYSKVYDSIVAVEPMSALLCNAFIGARPDHEVINKALELIIRNLNPQTAPDYIKHNTDAGWRTIIETGPALLTVAHTLASGKGYNTDIALPPMLIYPTLVNKYPYKDVVKPNGPAPAECIGGHYWETAWMRSEFGSQG